MQFYIPAIVGGLLIGVSASLLMFTLGKICGLSGIFTSLITRPKEDWRWFFISGFFLGALIIRFFQPQMVEASVFSIPMIWMIFSGLLVGVGTRMGGGCTSGHGVCGISRLSKRSIVATCAFILTGMIVVWIRSK